MPAEDHPTDIELAEELAEESALDQAVVAIAVLGRSLEQVLEDLTLAQFRLLALIDEAPQRASAVAARSSVTRASVSSIIKVLERRGLVVRLPADGDGRGVVLVLTEAGAAILADSRARVNDRMRVFLTRFDGEERAQILRLLALIAGSTGGPYSATQAQAQMGAAAARR